MWGSRMQLRVKWSRGQVSDLNTRLYGNIDVGSHREAVINWLLPEKNDYLDEMWPKEPPKDKMLKCISIFPLVLPTRFNQNTEMWWCNTDTQTSSSDAKLG